MPSTWPTSAATSAWPRSTGDGGFVSHVVLAWLPLADESQQPQQNAQFQDAFAVLVRTVNPAASSSQQADLASQLGLSSEQPPFPEGAEGQATLVPDRYQLEVVDIPGQDGPTTLIAATSADPADLRSFHLQAARICGFAQIRVCSDGRPLPQASDGDRGPRADVDPVAVDQPVGPAGLERDPAVVELGPVGRAEVGDRVATVVEPRQQAWRWDAAGSARGPERSMAGSMPRPSWRRPISSSAAIESDDDGLPSLREHETVRRDAVVEPAGRPGPRRPSAPHGCWSSVEVGAAAFAEPTLGRAGCGTSGTDRRGRRRDPRRQELRPRRASALHLGAVDIVGAVGRDRRRSLRPHAHRLRGAGVERHLVGRVDVALQPDRPGRRIGDVDHGGQQPERAVVPALRGELGGPAELRRGRRIVAGPARLEAVSMAFASSAWPV